MESARQTNFLEGFEDSKILRPSVAYRQACKSYPNRISELVFGSLLASYILGFVSVGISQAGTLTAESFCYLMIYLTISCSFCFLTAALYSVYHHSILTMPNVPLGDLNTDFVIAISQAILFGISVIFPCTFLVCLGVLLFIVAIRQEVKFRALAKFFYEKLKVNTNLKSAGDTAREQQPLKQETVRSLFRKRLVEAELLDGWGPLKASHYACASFALLGGLFICYLASPNTPKVDLLIWLANHYPSFCAIIYVVVGFILFLQTWRVLESKSVALDDDGREAIEKMDIKAIALARKIRPPTTSSN